MWVCSFSSVSAASHHMCSFLLFFCHSVIFLDKKWHYPSVSISVYCTERLICKLVSLTLWLIQYLFTTGVVIHCAAVIECATIYICLCVQTPRWAPESASLRCFEWILQHCPRSGAYCAICLCLWRKGIFVSTPPQEQRCLVIRIMVLTSCGV